MSEVQIFKRKIKIETIVFYSCFLLFFLLINFYLKPLIKEDYLQDEIDRFDDGVSWKIFLIIGSLFFIISLYKAKTLESKGEVFLGLLFLLILVFNFVTMIITNASLYINQITINESEKIILSCYKENIREERYLRLVGDKIVIDDYDEENIHKIEEIRNKNGLKPLNEISNNDTIHVVFKTGMLGFKYLK